MHKQDSRCGNCKELNLGGLLGYDIVYGLASCPDRSCCVEGDEVTARHCFQVENRLRVHSGQFIPWSLTSICAIALAWIWTNQAKCAQLMWPAANHSIFLSLLSLRWLRSHFGDRANLNFMTVLPGTNRKLGDQRFDSHYIEPNQKYLPK